MKKLYLIFMMLYFSYSFGLAQWRIAFSSTYPSGTTFQSIYFVNENVGWAVGSDGIILKTTDGGNSWTQQVSNTTSTLYFIQALDENNLFACGGNRNFLKSTDGGNTWSVNIIDVIPEPTGTIKKIKFFDLNTGYLLLSYSTTVGRIYKTTDGGTTWTQQYANTSNNLNDFDFASPSAGVAVGKSVGVLLYTTDGATWNQAPTPSLGGFNYTRSDVRGVKMINASTAVAVGWGSFAAGLQPSIHLKTTDGGANWTYMTQTEQNRSYDNLYNVWFKDQNNGLAIGGAVRGSVIERTTDGGVNWIPIAAPFGPTLYGIYGIGDKIWISGSDGLIAYSPDFGNTWIKLTPVPATTIYDIQFAGNNGGFAAGYQGTFLKSTNRGQIWTASYIFANNVCPNVNGIYFLNDNTGYAAHSYRLVTKTTDGGNTWFAVLPDSLYTTGHNYGVFFLNENLGWVCGQYGTSNGVIHKTTNGGQSWVTYQNVAAKALRAIAFRDENNGVVVGSTITAKYSTDGGLTWQTATVNGMTSGDIRDVVYLSPTRLIACGTNALLKSEDGGVTWNALPVSVSGLLYALTFKDNINGYAVGASGLVYKTTDGGDTWTQVTDPLFTSTFYAAATDQNGNPWFGSTGSNLITYSAQGQVTFNINMRVAILKGKFVPSTDLLVIRGNFNGWSGNADQLSDADGDSVYSITKTFNVGDNLEFKFV
ncbi:MAG: WD40/YVTN/BNR-like repeat-containing protein, partial [Ignavibacteria bacterium]